MKTALILGLLVLIALLVSGCVDNIFAKDCGADKSCFGEALSKCQKATYKQQGALLFEYEILEKTSEGCKLHYMASVPETGNPVQEFSCVVADYQKGEELIMVDLLFGTSIAGCEQ